MSFPRYPAYKDSGIEWLGKVPAHWGVCAVKRIAKLRSGDSITADDIDDAGTYPVYGGNGLRGYASSFTHNGNFVLIGRQGALCGNINYATGQFWASEHAVVVSPMKPVAIGWLGEMLRAMNLNQYSTAAAQPGLSVELIGDLRTVLPPLSEQTAISDFLDQETAKIDALIGEQQRLIELLKDKCQAVISCAVTKGLNLHAAMKPSDVEWLGEVPRHWTVGRLKHLVARRVAGPYGASLTKGMYTSSGYRVYGQQQVISNDFATGDYYIGAEKYEEMRRYTVSPGDVLVSVMGTIGKVAVVPSNVEPGIINPRLVLYRCGDQVVPEYLRAVLMSQAHQKVLKFESQGTTMDGLNMQILGEIPIPVPSVAEQIEVLARIRDAAVRFDALVREAQHAIDILQERRVALISAAVTGQVDVRQLLVAEAA